MKLNSFQKWSLAALLMVAGLTVLYVVYTYASNNGFAAIDLDVSDNTVVVFKWFIGFLVVAALIFAGYKVYSARNAPVDELDLPKKPVHLSVLFPLWLDAFIVNTLIPCRYQYHIDKKNPPISLQKGVSVKIMNETSFSSRETGDNYVIFEVLCNSGLKRGLNVFCVKTDAGEDWIRQNWNWRVREKIDLNRYKLDERNYPLNTPQSNQERLLNLQFEAMLSGEYTPEELRMFETIRQQASSVDSKHPVVQSDSRDVEPQVQYVSAEESDKKDALNSVEEAKRRAVEEQNKGES